MEKAAHKVKESSVTRDDRERGERLAAALRDNLRRRKAQARDRARPDEDAPAAAAPERP